MRNVVLGVGLAIAVVSGPVMTGPVTAQTMQGHEHGSADHSMAHGGMDDASSLSEPGQGAFAAISEIVATLGADPSTDWTRVDIDALRAHLVDMDLVVSSAEVSAKDVEDGLEMRVSTLGPAGAAAGRMVPMHGPVLAMETGFNSALARDGDALIWRVTGWSETDAQMIRALGFFGLMATGDHHRAHHLGLATGTGMH